MARRKLQQEIVVLALGFAQVRQRQLRRRCGNGDDTESHSGTMRLATSVRHLPFGAVVTTAAVLRVVV